VPAVRPENDVTGPVGVFDCDTDPNAESVDSCTTYEAAVKPAVVSTGFHDNTTICKPGWATIDGVAGVVVSFVDGMSADDNFLKLATPVVGFHVAVVPSPTFTPYGNDGFDRKVVSESKMIPSSRLTEPGSGFDHVRIGCIVPRGLRCRKRCSE
jgi:hypothetical protein